MKIWIAGLVGLAVGAALGAVVVAAWAPTFALSGSGLLQLVGAGAGAFVSVMTAFGVVQYQEHREAERVRTFVIATIDEVVDAGNALGEALMLRADADEGGTLIPPPYWANLAEKARALAEVRTTALNRLPRIEENLYKLDIQTLRLVFEVEDLLPALDPTIEGVIAKSKEPGTRMYGNVVPDGWSYPIGFYTGRLGNLRRRLEG